jgi:hypothetical protein
MGDVDMLAVWERAAEAERQEQFLRAEQDVRLLLEGQRPQEGRNYGYWKSYMALLLEGFEQEGVEGVQAGLVTLLEFQERDARRLLRKAVTSDGRYWEQVLRKRLHDKQERRRRAEEEARRIEAEARMQERLARTTGDSLADEVMAMLREHDLSRTDIYRRYSRNVTAAQINDALFVLERLGWARWKTVSTGGRKREVWYLPDEE